MTYSRFMSRVGVPALGEVADVAHVAGESCVEEIGVERDDHICIFQSYWVSTGCPKAIFAPSSTLSRLTGSYTCHLACG